jgi:Trypsin-like peptidase domain
MKEMFALPQASAVRMRLPKILFSAAMFWLCFPRPAIGTVHTGAAQFSAEEAAFSWEEAKSRSVQILVEYRDGERWKETNLGTGSLISPDGLFVTAYHVMQYCLEKQRDVSQFSDNVDCSAESAVLRYKARVDDREYAIQLVSHLREKDSTGGKEIQTPDETLKHRDFVLGKLKADSDERFSYWHLRDFQEGTINLAHPNADFELKPLLPPKKVFIAGYPKDRSFVISRGFLNLTEDNKRGYFAVPMNLYSAAYLKSQAISSDTQWGIRVENHMSGGPVVDAAGYLIGIVVTGDHSNAGVLSIENVLETFFSSAATATYPSFTLVPTQRPLYLKRSDSEA